MFRFAVSAALWIGFDINMAVDMTSKGRRTCVAFYEFSIAILLSKCYAVFALGLELINLQPEGFFF